MSIKTKLTSAKNATVTYFKEEGKNIVLAACVGGVVALAYTVRVLNKDLNSLGSVVNNNAAAGNYGNENPWYLEDGDPTKARRVSLSKSITDSNPT